MTTQYFCKNERRRALVRDTTNGGGLPLLNGIDYLEVSPDQQTLYVRFIHNLPGETDGVPNSPVLSASNMAIEGGVRIRDIRVQSISVADNLLTVNVDRSGDFSTYTLRLATSSTSNAVPSGFDPQLGEVDFSFKVDCPNDFDCAPDAQCLPEPLGPEPSIDYLAKDFASFRRLMSDRLSVVIPDWQERNVADLGTAIVENIAYVADYLSYYQDAVATEAYLGTARRRVSVRRHARILDYHMHEGCNSRAWVQIQLTGNSNIPLPKGTQLLTRVEGQPRVLEQGSIQHETAMSQNPAVFETLHDSLLHQSHNEIPFYTWGDAECCLPQGATRATLRDDAGNRLLLRPGDVLVFEEVKGPSESVVVDPSHRHVVRLTSVSPQATQPVAGQRTAGPLTTDPLTEDPIVEIEWSLQDELPFSLCLSTGQLDDVAVARGNIVLASHGETIFAEEVVVPEGTTSRPTLQEPNVTYSQDYNHDYALLTPAAGLLNQEPTKALPEITLELAGASWIPRRDLLNSGRSSTHFVAETEDTGVSYLRFGDGVLGRRPMSGSTLLATYRVGNGRSGNAGADAIYHIVTSDDPSIFLGVRNPLAAQGGTDPEPVQQVKHYAPQAFRTQERAVTEGDYAGVAQRHPEVQKAVATRRWTGSWHTMFITVDRKEGRPVDADFEDTLRDFIETYRLAGHDLEIEPPLFVPLDLAMTVCVQPEYFRSAVKETLQESFSPQSLRDGSKGFWHPDNFTFGQTVYLSQIIAAAMEVPGVMWVDLTKFQRWGKPDLGELGEGRILLDRLEIAQLDNDPSQPENGRMEFHMEGGL